MFFELHKAGRTDFATILLAMNVFVAFGAYFLGRNLQGPFNTCNFGWRELSTVARSPGLQTVPGVIPGHVESWEKAPIGSWMPWRDAVVSRLPLSR